ncbi:MAG: FKBP-type peptidyl-prolyl cis-trans isomerase [Ekhidna sp.]
MKMKKSLLRLYLLGTLMLAGCFGGDETPSFEEQLAADIALIEQYLTDNDIDAEVHESGIRYIRTEEGSGATPAANDVFVAKYTGSIMGGNQFTESKYGNSFTLNANLIRAWQIMLQEMNEGGKLTMYAPSGYCFGINSSAEIPANSILTFDVELVRVVDDAEEQFTADTIIIDEYLEDKGIEALVHESGIRYTVEEEGTGESPEEDSQIEVKYAGLFIDGASFDANQDGAVFNLAGHIQAWQIMIPEMKEGGKITIYAPSKFCYGPSGSGAIPPNTALVFEIELVQIIQ